MARKVPSTFPKPMALVVCSDKNLFWQGLFFLNRAATFDPDHTFDIYYYISDPLPKRYRALVSDRIKVVRWKGDLLSENANLPSTVTKATLMRIFALDELSTRYQRILYSDIDVFQRWGNFGDLRKLPDFSEPLAAVRNHTLWYGEDQVPGYAQRYLSRYPEAVQKKYFNAGVLLVNSAVWRDQEISSQAITMLNEQSEFCRFADQSALNAVVGGNWLELSPGWNWQISRPNSFLIPMRNPRLIHFLGGAKPWSDVTLAYDEHYRLTMIDWLVQHRLDQEVDELRSIRLNAAAERRRTRELSSQQNHLHYRERINAYTRYPYFADAVAGIKGYG